jgi:hypothetical protein
LDFWIAQEGVAILRKLNRLRIEYFRQN